jgi:hypothetical protein
VTIGEAISLASDEVNCSTRSVVIVMPTGPAMTTRRGSTRLINVSCAALARLVDAPAGTVIMHPAERVPRDGRVSALGRAVRPRWPSLRPYLDPDAWYRETAARMGTDNADYAIHRSIPDALGPCPT